jgi:hypothetical protein
LVLGLALLLAACGAASVPASLPASTTATPSAESTPAAESAAARSTPTITPTVRPRPTSAPTSEPTAFGAAVFDDPDDCTNPDAGYRVAYPDSWYSNASSEGIAACWLFAPTDFDLTYGTEIPVEVAVVIREYDEWNSDTFSGRRVLSDQQTVVDGLPARVQEIEITERTIALAPGDRFTEYVVELEDGSYLVAATYLGSDYESAKSVLSDMMATMQVGTP